ncbi:hypothetical protein Q1695_004796 [Nippostrongylus brasiliensis]|nr:hypothetical protein Q1695_004796 [Nippostrongylus brasiliensis]
MSQKSAILLLLLLSFTTAQNDVFTQPHVPTFVLIGPHRLVSRRIWHGAQVDYSASNTHVQVREPLQVQILAPENHSGPFEGRRTTVYRRVLRPAKLIYNGGDVVTHQWVGPAGQYGTNAFQYQQKGRAYGEEHEYESRIPPEPRQYDVPGHN